MRLIQVSSTYVQYNIQYNMASTTVLVIISFLSSVHHELFGRNLTQAASNLHLEQLLRTRPALLPRLSCIRQLDLIIRRRRRRLAAAQERETALTLVLLHNVRNAEEALHALQRLMDSLADQAETADSEESFHAILYDIMDAADHLPRLEEEVLRTRAILTAFENLAADPPSPQVEEEAYEAQKITIWETLYLCDFCNKFASN